MEVTLTSFMAETRAAMKHLNDSLETLKNYAVPAQPRSTPPSVSINPIISQATMKLDLYELSVCVSSIHNAPVYSLYNTREKQR